MYTEPRDYTKYNLKYTDVYGNKITIKNKIDNEDETDYYAVMHMIRDLMTCLGYMPNSINNIQYLDWTSGYTAPEEGYNIPVLLALKNEEHEVVADEWDGESFKNYNKDDIAWWCYLPHHPNDYISYYPE